MKLLRKAPRLPAYVRDRATRTYKRIRADFYVDLNHDQKKTTLVAGSGRGGTTWLAEIINADNDFRDVFEPVRPAKSVVCRHFRDRQYLRASDDDPLYVQPMRLILEGRTRSFYSDQFNKRFLCNRRIIKEVRVNNLLRWIKVHFPEVPLIWILRHPCAVAHSRTTGTWNGAFDVQDLLAQPQLIQDHISPFVDLVTRARDEFERHVAVWCVENYVPLRELHKGDALVVFYEDLCTKPAEQVRRLTGYLNLDNASSMLRRVGAPSSQVRTHAAFRSAVVVGEDLVSFWRQYVQPEQVERAMRLVEAFGLSHIYGPEPLPRLGSDEVLP